MEDTVAIEVDGKPLAILVHEQSVTAIVHRSLNWESSQLCCQGQRERRPTSEPHLNGPSPGLTGDRRIKPQYLPNSNQTTRRKCHFRFISNSATLAPEPFHPKGKTPKAKLSIVIYEAHCSYCPDLFTIRFEQISVSFQLHSCQE